MGICKHAASDECNFAVEAEEFIEVVEFGHDARCRRLPSVFLINPW
jgi:hypothetical protein